MSVPRDFTPGFRSWSAAGRRWVSVLLFVSFLSCAMGTPEETPPGSGPGSGLGEGATSSAPAIESTAPGPTTTSPGPEAGVLVFHATAGFRHASIETGVEVVGEIGRSAGFDVHSTDEAAVFADLSRYQVIVFLNTTGDILDEAQQDAMEGSIASGTGFVGIHSAADTEYEWPWYGELVGAYFDSHPPSQSAMVSVTAADHPITGGVPPVFEVSEEWYNFASPPPEGAVVLAEVDEGTYEGGTMGERHPVVWAHTPHGGRAVYLAFGHDSKVFTEPPVNRLLANAIQWAAGATP